ncbi:MAG: MraY family glycosyltransferase [Phycisphaeraceae bacterium]
MAVICLWLMVAALAVNLPVTWWLIGAGRRWGQLDQPGDAASHKQHGRSVPSTGGIGIFLTLAVPLLIALVAVHLFPLDAFTGWLAPLRAHVPGLRAHSAMGFAILAAMLALHIMGLIDDRRRLGPYSKLLVQVIVAAVLASVFDLRVLHLLDAYGALGTVASIAISVIWIVTIINAINFLDNMDGLAAGVSAVIAAIYLAATLIGGQWFVAALAAMLLGALAAFLVFNFPPAKIFMGDSGSLVVGLLLAVISVRTTYFAPQASDLSAGVGEQGHWYGLLMPLIIMAVPLYDITSVTLIRLSQGRSPFYPDNQHFSHRLVKKGLSKRTAVIVIWLCTLATGLGGVMLGRLEGWQAALVAGQTIAVLAVLALLERTKA